MCVQTSRRAGTARVWTGREREGRVVGGASLEKVVQRGVRERAGHKQIRVFLSRSVHHPTSRRRHLTPAALEQTHTTQWGPRARRPCRPRWKPKRSLHWAPLTPPPWWPPPWWRQLWPRWDDPCWACGPLLRACSTCISRGGACGGEMGATGACCPPAPPLQRPDSHAPTPHIGGGGVLCVDLDTGGGRGGGRAAGRAQGR